MKIEVSKKGSEALYREVVNTTAQYRRILRNHHCRLKDLFREFRILLILGAAFLVINILTAIFWGADPFDYVLIGFLSIEVVMCVCILVSLNKRLRSMMADSGTVIISLDDEGIEYSRPGSQTIKLAWDTIAFARVFPESLAFLSAERSGIVISIAKQYADGVLTWLRENRPSLEVVERLK